jgi:AcrR family transcriptional regulator
MRAGTKRPGGRSADNLARILTATADLLVEKGYGRLSTEEVAERAGVHRSTVHRRFPTRAELVAQMMTSLAAERVPVPDTGRLEDDLLAFARAVRRATADPIAGALTRAVVAEGGDRTELGAASAAFWAQRWQAAGDIVRRAIARGELPETTDHRLLIELVVAPIQFRTFITADPVPDDLLTDIVTTVVRGAR